MLQRFIPRKDVFFTLFAQLAEKSESGAFEFLRLLQNLNTAPAHAKQIASLEKQGDQIARRIFDELHKTFVTPFDRNDIHTLTTDLDDVLDQINRAARRIALYEINVVPADMLIIGNLCTQATNLLKQSISMLEKLTKSKSILQLCDNVDEVQESADKILSAGMSQLFAHETDFKRLLKMKEIYESLQGIFDSCQDVAHVIKGIVLEYS